MSNIKITDIQNDSELIELTSEQCININGGEKIGRAIGQTVGVIIGAIKGGPAGGTLGGHIGGNVGDTLGDFGDWLGGKIYDWTH